MTNDRDAILTEVILETIKLEQEEKNRLCMRGWCPVCDAEREART